MNRADRRHMKTLGRAGGKARAKKLTPEARQAIARLGGLARWGKKTGAKKGP